MRKIFLLIFLSITISSLHGQKVGLVLSGGGAKGLAHIGVIQALEEHNIPIDYITGTSMGAIIGGLYAIGYSPEEMKAIVTSESFPKWANGEKSEEFIYYFKKGDVTPTLFDFTIEIEDSEPKAKLPGSLVPTHLMDLQLLNFFSTASAKANYNFDKLFIPFRCVATDITNNKEVVFSSGSLTKAIRASMTFPFYYRPIREDSIVYFDGGMKNNFPSDVMMKDFQPDYIIGSKTAKNAPIPKTDDVLLQLQNMLLGETDYDLADSVGHTINIDLENFSLFNFRRAERIIQVGYKAAINDLDKIRPNIQRSVDSVQLAQSRTKFRETLPQLNFQSIEVQGLSEKTTSYIKNYLDKIAKPFNLYDFKKSYFKLLADNNISTIYPTAWYDTSTQSFTLNLDVNQESQIQAGIGGNISSGNINQGFGEIQYNHLGRYAKQASANVYFGRLYSSAKIAGRIDFPANPEISLKTSFILNRWDFFNSSNEPFFEDVRPSYLIQNESFSEIETSIPIKYNRRLNIGFNIGRIRPEYYLNDEFFKSDTTDKTKLNYFYPFISLEKNTLNHNQYATEGAKYSFKAYYLNGKEQFIPGSNDIMTEETSSEHQWFNLNLKYKKYFPVSKHFVLGLSGEFNFTDQDFFSNYYSTLLSSRAYQPFPHSKTLFMENYVGHNYLGGAIHPIFKFTKSFHLRSTLAAFQPYRQILKNNLKQPEYGKRLDRQFYLGNLSLVYHTVIGPVSLSLNYYNKKNNNLYFLFNFGYILSNDKALN